MKENKQILYSCQIFIHTVMLHLQVHRKPGAPLCCRQLSWVYGFGIHVPGVVLWEGLGCWKICWNIHPVHKCHSVDAFHPIVLKAIALQIFQ